MCASWRSAGDESEDFGDAFIALVARGSFEVQSQERFGVRGTEVEPPGPAVDRESVNPVLGILAIGARDPVDRGGRVPDLRVDLARIGVALKGPAELRQRDLRLRELLEEE